MATNLTLLPPNVLADCISHYKENTRNPEVNWHDIARVLENESPEKLFNRYCEWNGLINYGDKLWHTVMSLNNARQTPTSPRT